MEIYQNKLETTQVLDRNRSCNVHSHVIFFEEIHSHVIKIQKQVQWVVWYLKQD
jgi:hypothetical protein